VTEKAARSTQLEKLRQQASQSAIASNNYPRGIKFSIFLQRARFRRVPPRVWSRRKYKSRPKCGYYLKLLLHHSHSQYPAAKVILRENEGDSKNILPDSIPGVHGNNKKRYTANLLKAQFSFHTGEAHMRPSAGSFCCSQSGHNFPK